MSELKTLKDIEIRVNTSRGADSCVDTKQLRQELAIKYIQELMKPVMHLGNPIGNEIILKNN